MHFDTYMYMYDKIRHFPIPIITQKWMLKSLSSMRMSRVAVFSHLAEGIDRLQSEFNLVPESYIGFLVLSSLQLQHIYKQLSDSGPNGLKFCMPLASAILADMNRTYAFKVTNSCSPIPLKLSLLH